MIRLSVGLEDTADLIADLTQALDAVGDRPSPAPRLRTVTSRERQARRAFSTLGEQRVLAFLRAVRNDGSCKAAGFVNEQLDNGELLEDIFFDGNEFGYRMSVKTRGPHLFEVEFGCRPDRWSVTAGCGRSSSTRRVRSLT